MERSFVGLTELIGQGPHRAGGRIELQPGCAEVLQRAAHQGVPCHVISVNWSHALVRAALAPAVQGPAGQSQPLQQRLMSDGASLPLLGANGNPAERAGQGTGEGAPPGAATSPSIDSGGINIQCNDLELDNAGGATGHFIRCASSHKPACRSMT